jgi:hypothetical protein
MADEKPKQPVDRKDPLCQVDFLNERFSYLAGLCGDVEADLDFALDGGRQDSAGVSEAPFVFKAFAGTALSLVRRNNPVYADVLSRLSPEPGSRFRISWVDQRLPFVQVREHEQWVGLSRFVSMYEDAGRMVDRFVGATGYHAGTHAVVFAGPGNWAHVVEFAKRYPAAEMIIADPWPALFAQLAERGCFVHRLPASALILGTIPSCSDWRDLFASRIRAWRDAGRDILVFEHPERSRISDIDTLTRELRELVGRPAVPAGVGG